MEKELLLVDLCARLPYGVKVCSPDKTICSIWSVPTISVVTVINGSGQSSHPIKDIKPYLRPLSSMTKEEKESLRQEHLKDERLFADCIKKSQSGNNSLRGKVITHYAADWCNAHHFDFRNLIEKGLALEALEGMYNLNND